MTITRQEINSAAMTLDKLFVILEEKQNNVKFDSVEYWIIQDKKLLISDIMGKVLNCV